MCDISCYHVHKGIEAINHDPVGQTIAAIVHEYFMVNMSVECSRFSQWLLLFFFYFFANISLKYGVGVVTEREEVTRYVNRKCPIET